MFKESNVIGQAQIELPVLRVADFDNSSADRVVDSVIRASDQVLPAEAFGTALEELSFTSEQVLSMRGALRNDALRTVQNARKGAFPEDLVAKFVNLLGEDTDAAKIQEAFELARSDNRIDINGEDWTVAKRRNSRALFESRVDCLRRLVSRIGDKKE